MFYKKLTRRDLALGATSLGLSMIGRRVGAQPASAPDMHVLHARVETARLPEGTGEPVTQWRFAGAVPGPILRVRQGEELRGRLVNDLPRPMCLHWHGVRLANAMDGVPYLTQAPVDPGASFDYRFRCPDAGTFWYRTPQPTGPARGLSGILLVQEHVSVTTDHDFALLLDGWPSHPDRPAHESANPAPGREARMTANGTAMFDVPVRPNERVRLRLVNASAHIAWVILPQHRVFVMALDGQPTEPFVARDSRLLLGPGNRADLMVDATFGPGADAPILVATQKETRTVARLRYGRIAARAAPLADPEPLPPNPLPARLDLAGAHRHELALGDPAAKDAPFGAGADDTLGPPLFSVARGRTASLAFANRTDGPAVVHVHGHAFRLLDRLDDGWKPFWLDTVVVPPRSTQRIAFVADNPGKWLIDGRILGPGSTTRTWFEVR